MEKIETKICSKCSIKKLTKDFSDRDSAKGGKRNQCRIGVREGAKLRQM